VTSARPRLIILCGPPCSGKSPIAADLERDQSLPRLEMDAIRERLFPHGSNTPEERQVSYAAMHSCAKHLLQARVDRVLLVATYQPWQVREAVAGMAGEFRSPLWIIQLKVDSDDAVRRFLSRPDNHPAKDLTAARVRQLAESYKYFRRAPIFDTSRLGFEEVYRAVVDCITIVDATAPGPVPPKFFAEWVESAREPQT
jgi:predicted kinase